MSSLWCIPPASQVDLKREERLEEIRHAAEKQGQLKVVERASWRSVSTSNSGEWLLSDSAPEATALDLGDPSFTFSLAEPPALQA